ncbi:ABC transporter permease [Parapedobacter koreensis]|uniref:Putative ABC transport system permease protein n=1 Tax=Parapedobacter koreensis TaxID=332977 RepID=A0A1H7QAC4_9SPHI|nr:ABC transporter permease [Parapedobacter koreensis]SEL45111.1 putative ABC transport system permease protein [Parapedobacter koreensis]
MNLNNLKIAWRNVLRTKLFTAFNILGLALGFAGFILAYLYINRETSYDRWNPNYDNIYLVGLSYQGQYTDLTPPALATAIKAKLPEVVEVGRVSYFPYELPFISDDGETFVRDWKAADLSIAKMFGVEAYGISVTDTSLPELNLITPEIAKALFPNDAVQVFEPRLIALQNEQSGMYYHIHGATRPRRLSNLTYDAIFFKPDLAGDKEGDPLPYQTYIQVKPGTDIALLDKKIKQVYKQEISQHHHVVTSAFAKGDTYLDPLKDLHLRPQHGSNTGYITVWALAILSGVILLLAGINFANLMIAQANKRAKEIGLKKVFGVSRVGLALQFMGEVVFQCVLAAGLSWLFVLLCGNALQKWLNYDLAFSALGGHIAWQLLLAAAVTALVSGIYPSVVLSGYHPVNILKGNFQTSHRTAWFRHTLLTFQFIIAMVFISGMLILNRQLNYIRDGDKGFDPAQVVYIKNAMLLNNPADFKPFRDRIQSYPGIEYVTAATSVPGGIGPAEKEFEYVNEARKADHIAVDFDYVQTMGMEVLQGRSFTETFAADSAKGAIINETFAKTFGMQNPIGQTIRGCETDFQIVGVVKDSKMEGFERLVRPTVYSINNACGQFKTEILVKIKPGTARQTLVALEKDWKSINRLDGEHFRYEFVDRKYAALHAQQEQLESAFSAFTILSISIAMMGLFSMSAYSVSIRQKEMSIRKVLGASVSQLFLQLNKPFLRIFLLANLIALPLAYLLIDRWLAIFAYRIAVQWWMFALAGCSALLIAFFTVAYQSVRAARANPVESLRDE